MRTLNTQVRLRRLIRSFDEAWVRLATEPLGLNRAGSVVSKLQALADQVGEAWQREGLINPQPAALEAYTAAALRAMRLAIAGLEQRGADLDLLRQDFQVAALPLEYFLRGLDVVEPALQRTA
ncbi:MAG: hypothetical protein ACHQ0J_04385 [Candidatus Dormibacterales bacterium]